MKLRKSILYIAAVASVSFLLAFPGLLDDPGKVSAAEAAEVELSGIQTVMIGSTPLGMEDDGFAIFHSVRQEQTMTENDEYILLQIAMAEAGDQDIEGKALVMNVIMNRIRDDEFPSTVEDVVMQPGQFEPVDNGSFYEVTPDWGCVEALEMVADGWDESCGATYFEESYDGSWQSSNLEKLFVHGCHTFYREYPEIAYGEEDI